MHPNATQTTHARYFSGPKIRWLLDNVDEVRTAAERGDAMFGTIDTWLLWNLTGGAGNGSDNGVGGGGGGGAGSRGIHATDVSNASRTLLMDLDTLQWDSRLLDAFGVPRSMLPSIMPSSSPSAFGAVEMPETGLGGVPITGILGDQQVII